MQVIVALEPELLSPPSSPCLCPCSLICHEGCELVEILLRTRWIFWEIAGLLEWVDFLLDLLEVIPVDAHLSYACDLN
jgi:hypothetical protein